MNLASQLLEKKLQVIEYPAKSELVLRVYIEEKEFKTTVDKIMLPDFPCLAIKQQGAPAEKVVLQGTEFTEFVKYGICTKTLLAYLGENSQEYNK